MPVTPAWQAPASGQQANAGAVNQLLGTHAITYAWTGLEQSSQSTAGSGAAGSNSLWIAQKFTTAAGQTTVGYMALTLQVTGSPSTWAVSIQASSGSAPSGTALVSTSVPKEFIPSASPGIRNIILPVTGLTAAATYWIVAQAVGDPSDFFAWSKSNQASGASTSTNGTSWTAQTYGLLYQVWDQTPAAPVTGTWEDSGARWTSLAYNGSGQLARVQEYTAGQTTTGYAAVSRTLSYTSGLLTGVA